MFDIFTDPAKMAQQMEIILDTYGFAVWETLYALALEVLFAYIIGLPLGVLLVTGEKDGIKPLPGWVMKTVNVVINLLRSVPFLILMIIALPLSKIIVGTKVGTEATIPPMVVAAFPLVARMVESSLREVNQGVVEAAKSMGASTWQIITKVLLPEALPSLIHTSDTRTWVVCPSASGLATPPGQGSRREGAPGAAFAFPWCGYRRGRGHLPIHGREQCRLQPGQCLPGCDGIQSYPVPMGLQAMALSTSAI